MDQRLNELFEKYFLNTASRGGDFHVAIVLLWKRSTGCPEIAIPRARVMGPSPLFWTKSPEMQGVGAAANLRTMGRTGSDRLWGRSGLLRTGLPAISSGILENPGPYDVLQCTRWHELGEIWLDQMSRDDFRVFSSLFLPQGCAKLRTLLVWGGGQSS
jgi:hypothetical protein